MFKKVDSFTKGHQLSRTHSVFVCADGAYWAMIRFNKTSWIYEKRKQKYLGSFVFFAEKKSDSEEI